MCGIAGIFSINKTIDSELITRMTDSLQHRGPDDEGNWSNKSCEVILGHRRLSILDLSKNGNQPMHYNNRYTITFNGEIYNYIEIKKSLEKEGYEFKTGTDTEVLLILYEKKRELCLNDLDGMFAFAIWDEQEQTLFCARDRFGEKPFYYSYDPMGGFYFASEMKALWSVGISKIVDEEMMRNFILSGSVLDSRNQEKTFYPSIKQLDSACYLIISHGRFKPNIFKYYTLENIELNKKITFSTAKEEFLYLLEESVKIRLRSDVPIGSSLSGGLDSSSIVLLIDKLKGNQINQKTFSARFKNFEKDEGKYIQKIIEQIKYSEHYEVYPNYDELQSVIQEIIYHQEEPFGSTSIFAQWKVMELAKNSNIKVLMDGQGADEQLGGYLFYYNQYFSQLYQNNYPLFRKEVASYENLRECTPPLLLNTKNIRSKIGRIKRNLFKKTISISSNHLSNSLKNDMTVTGLKELLRYADRNSMAHSIEVRLPFLSHKLVEFVFSLPDSFKLKDGWTKLILREAMVDYLPHKIRWRLDKIGFETPQNEWLNQKNNLRKNSMVENYLIDSKIINSKGDIDKISDWSLYMLSEFIK